MDFYTYVYLRVDGSPYYIGKGKGNRAYKKRKNGANPPKDQSRIIFLKQNLTEEEAFKHEIYMIAMFGRKDLGTGILHNRTNGGEGSSGAVRSDEFKRNQSERTKGKNNPNYGKSPSEGTRKKMSEANKGKSLSEETRRKLKDANIGKSLSKETKIKMRDSHIKYSYVIIYMKENEIITYETNTLNGFCNEHLLCFGHLNDTISGKRKHHKGFRIIKKERIASPK
jgi:hypothetical protein